MESISIAVEIVQLFKEILSLISRLRGDRRVEQQQLLMIERKVEKLKERVRILSDMSKDVIRYKDLHEKLVLIPEITKVIHDKIEEIEEGIDKGELKMRLLELASDYSGWLVTRSGDIENFEGSDDRAREDARIIYNNASKIDEKIKMVKNACYRSEAYRSGVVLILDGTFYRTFCVDIYNMIKDIDSAQKRLVAHLDEKIKSISEGINEVSCKMSIEEGGM